MKIDKSPPIINHKIINNQLQQLQQRLAHTLTDIETTAIADASVLIAITNEDNPKILLTRRASHMKSHAGEVSFAGGKYESTDTTNIATALRETYEETNLDPNCLQIIGQLKTQTSKSGLSVRPIVAIMPAEERLSQPLIAEESEIARIFWMNLQWLITAPTQDYRVTVPIKQSVKQPAKQSAIQTNNHQADKQKADKQQTSNHQTNTYVNVQMDTPSWQVQGEIVWGLTGRIIANMLKVGFDRHVEWYYHLVTE